MSMEIEVRTMEWKPYALNELEKVPEHVRSMAKMGIETAVEKKGKPPGSQSCAAIS